MTVVRHVTLLWTNLATGDVQRRCLCGGWESQWARDTPENRRILRARATDHIDEETGDDAGS